MVLIGLALRLDRNEWFIALLFGIALDLDHLFAAPRYVTANGWGAILRPTWDDGSGIPWRSLLHEPVGAFVVMPLAVGWRFMLPLLFWSAHVGIDNLQNATLAYSAAVEVAVFSATIGSIVWILYRRWSELQGDDADFRKFLSYAGASLRSYLSLS